MDPKIQNFQNFQKTVKYVIQLPVVYQCTQIQVNNSIFDPQMKCFCLPKSYPYITSFFSNAIFVTSGGRTLKNDTIRFLSQN